MDMAIVGIILLGASISLMFGWVLLEQFYSAPIISDNEILSANWEAQQVTLAIIANSFILIFISAGIASAIGAYYTETHPMFFIFSIISLAVCVMILALFSDIFVELASSGILLPVAAELVLMVETMANLKTLGLIMGAVIVLALFAKKGDLGVGGTA